MSPCQLNSHARLILFRFLFTLFLAIDANFKLKNKDRGIKDFELDPGYGCYVENSRYKSHLAQYVDQQEVYYYYLVCKLKANIHHL